MRFVGLLLVVVLAFMASNAIAVPNCSQVNSSDFCFTEPSCAPPVIEWRGTCENLDRQWRCVWVNCSAPFSPTEYGPWTDCNCEGEGGGEGCDCLLRGTPITLADGTAKPVEAIRVSDQVLGYDVSARSMKPALVTAVYPPFAADHYFVINGRIRTTEAHPVLSNGTWMAVGELHVGDALTSASGAQIAIFSIERVDESVATYNFQVSTGTYVAGGIVVHNKDICQNFEQFPEP